MTFNKYIIYVQDPPSADLLEIFRNADILPDEYAEKPTLLVSHKIFNDLIEKGCIWLSHETCDPTVYTVVKDEEKK